MCCRVVICTPKLKNPVTDKQFYGLHIRPSICLVQFCFFCMIRLLALPLHLCVIIKVALINQSNLFGWIFSIIFSFRQEQLKVVTGFWLMWCFCNLQRFRLVSAQGCIQTYESYSCDSFCTKMYGLCICNGPLSYIRNIKIHYCKSV